MKRGVRDRDSANKHRRQPSHGRHGAGAPHLEFERFERGDGFLRRRLEGEGPPRRAAQHPRCLLQGQVIELKHHAINVVIEFRALREATIDEGQYRLRPFTARGVGVHGQSPSAGAYRGLRYGFGIVPTPPPPRYRQRYAGDGAP